MKSPATDFSEILSELEEEREEEEKDKPKEKSKPLPFLVLVSRLRVDLAGAVLQGMD